MIYTYICNILPPRFINRLFKSCKTLFATKPIGPFKQGVIEMQYLIGNAAGTIWHYLNQNGESSVTKIVKETQLEAKLVQRALGWLSAEGKLKFDRKGRSETISLN